MTEFTDRYIYVNTGAPSTAIGTGGVDYPIKRIIKFPNDIARVPNIQISLDGGFLVSDDEHAGLILKCDISAYNYEGLDNDGCVLALFDNQYDFGGGGVHYAIQGNTPKLNFSSVNQITLFIEDGNGIAIPWDTSGLVFSFLFKIRYPKQPDQIQQDFAGQITRAL